MTKFRHASDVVGGVVTLSLAGVLDEDSDLERLVDDLAGDVVSIDLAEVERINGAGLAAWRKLVATLDGLGTRVVVTRCSGAMNAQLTRADARAVEIESVAIPYFCPECDEPRTLYAEVRELGKPAKAPAGRCPGCDLVMQFDDRPAYFAFLGLGVARMPEPEPSMSSPRLPTQPAVVESNRPLLILAVAAVLLIAGIALALSFSS